MKRLWLGLAAATAALAVPAAASAYTAYATGDVNMRTCASTQCARILVVPAGAAVNVVATGSWDYVSYYGYSGYVAGNYLTTGYTVQPPIIVQPPIYPVRPYPRPYYYGSGYYYGPSFSFDFRIGR